MVAVILLLGLRLLFAALGSCLCYVAEHRNGRYTEHNESLHSRLMGPHDSTI
jgi:hypothetical protein